jgi:hypothetical protein
VCARALITSYKASDLLPTGQKPRRLFFWHDESPGALLRRLTGYTFKGIKDE